MWFQNWDFSIRSKPLASFGQSCRQSKRNGYSKPETEVATTLSVDCSLELKCTATHWPDILLQRRSQIWKSENENVRKWLERLGGDHSSGELKAALTENRLLLDYFVQTSIFTPIKIGLDEEVTKYRARNWNRTKSQTKSAFTGQLDLSTTTFTRRPSWPCWLWHLSLGQRQGNFP